MSVSLPFDPFIGVLVQDVGAIRGALALWGVIDINVNEVQREFIPETEEEKKALSITSIKYQRRDRELLPTVPQVTDLVVRSVISRRSLGAYEIPLEFYRRGSADQYDEQYIEAIFNFYFVLEYLYADGKFRKRDVAANFLASPQIRKGLEEARDQFVENVKSANVIKQFRAKYGGRDDEATLNAIVELRGQLHHQSLSRPNNWNPTRQDEFRMDAHFLGAICQSVLMDIVLGVLYDDEEKAQFLATRFLNARDESIQVTDREQLDKSDGS